MSYIGGGAGSGGAIAGAGLQIQPLNITQLSAMAAGQMSQLDEITHLSGRGISIRIVPATGGTIISIRNENQIAGASELYVINDDQDLGAEIGKIITMHYLKT
jgi:hypothetical protein